MRICKRWTLNQYQSSDTEFKSLYVDKISSQCYCGLNSSFIRNLEKYTLHNVKIWWHHVKILWHQIILEPFEVVHIQSGNHIAILPFLLGHCTFNTWITGHLFSLYFLFSNAASNARLTIANTYTILSHVKPCYKNSTVITSKSNCCHYTNHN